jgi:hypothetical protein
MDKQEELVNAIAEKLTLRADDEQGEKEGSILAGVTLDLDQTARLGKSGFMIKLADGSRFEIRVTPSRADSN